MNFCSDNVTGIAPEILAAIEAANGGSASSYGEDAWTARAVARFREVFETDVEVFPVATGTAANALALSVMTPPFGAVFCHPESHINVHQCGAPEFFTGGAKLLTVEGAHGKVPLDGLQRSFERIAPDDVHLVQPRVLSLTQASDLGTLYTPDEVTALAAAAHERGLLVHMDGARFANAVAALGVSPAALSWRAGVDALAFGATKNGALAAEAVLFFRPELARELGFRRKRAGHLFSKMRFVSAQLDAFLTDDLWLRQARHANTMAARLAAGLGELPAVRIHHPVEVNMIFAELPAVLSEGLLADGFAIVPWSAATPTLFRLVTAFDTRKEDVDAFLASAQRHIVSA